MLCDNLSYYFLQPRKKSLTFQQVEVIGFSRNVKKTGRLFRIRRRDYAAQYILPFGS